jgi:hypothetical protein
MPPSAIPAPYVIPAKAGIHLLFHPILTNLGNIPWTRQKSAPLWEKYPTCKTNLTGISSNRQKN